MISKFHEVDRAIAYLREGMDGPLLECACEVTFYRDGVKPRTRRRTIVRNVGPLLEGFCRHFPEATVTIIRRHGKLPIAAIQSRADLRRPRCRRPEQ